MFFIVWGSKGRWSVKRDQGGQFFCPNCGGDRNWVLAVLRRWFTLFWIPLFPTGKPVGQAVQCETCHTRFQDSVLQQATTTEMALELQGSMRLGVATVVRAAGGSGSATAVQAVQRSGLAEYDHEALDHDIANLDVSGFGDHLEYLSGSLSLPGKEQFLGSLVQVAAADGGIEPAKAVLEQIGAGLGLTPAHVTGVLATPMTASADLAVPPPMLGATGEPPPEDDAPGA